VKLPRGYEALSEYQKRRIDAFTGEIMRPGEGWSVADEEAYQLEAERVSEARGGANPQLDVW